MVKEKGVHPHLVITMFEWLVEYMPQLLKGFIVTLQLAGIGLAIGSVLGLTLAIIRVYGNRIISIVAAFYVEVVRGTPLLVQIFLIYYGFFMGLGIDRFIAAFLAIGLNSAAYQAEYFRGAIESVSKGQMIAARSIGMSKIQSILHVILPQSLRLVLPAWSNEAAYLPKYTVVAFTIGVMDLLAQAKGLVGWYVPKPFEVYTIVALIFLVLISSMSTFLDKLYKKFKIPGL